MSRFENKETEIWDHNLLWALDMALIAMTFNWHRRGSGRGNSINQTLEMGLEKRLLRLL